MLPIPFLSHCMHHCTCVQGSTRGRWGVDYGERNGCHMHGPVAHCPISACDHEYDVDSTPGAYNQLKPHYYAFYLKYTKNDDYVQ